MARLFEKTSFFWLTLALVLLLVSSAVAHELTDVFALRLLGASSTVLLLLSLLSLGTERKRLQWFVAIIGLIFSVMYSALLELSPDAFRGLESGPWYQVMQQTTYFSFVTIATLGYGDISPASPVARVIVILEAVTGTFYMAIVVASLIGAYFGQGRRNDSLPED